MVSDSFLASFFHFRSSFRLFRRRFSSWLQDKLNLISGVGCLAIIVVLVLNWGFHLDDSNELLFSLLHFYLLLYYVVDISLRVLISKNKLLYFVKHPTDILVLYTLTYYDAEMFNFLLMIPVQFILGIFLLGRLHHVRVLLLQLKIKPALIFLLGFLLTIFIGSLLLCLPISIATGQSISYVDALFTAFSAVCVTGLVVNDVGTVFSSFGQWVLLLLIQIGGLGIMSFSVLLALLLQRKVSQMHGQEYQENYAAVTLEETYQMIGFIFRFTFLFELIGASLLFFFWRPFFDSLPDVLFHSLFHAVSAFCNAGFSLFSDSLMSFSYHWGVILIISGLIIVGGLGFPVLFNLYQHRYRRFRHRPLRLQTRLALWVTGVLLVVGTVIIFLFESERSLAGLPLAEQWLSAFFQNVSARTAGFNSVDISLFHPGTLVFMMIIMVIGASPGSTGGGIKTTTFGLLSLSFWNTLKSSRRIDVGYRQVDQQSQVRAFSLLFLAISLILGFFLALLFFESGDFVHLLFETVSAFGTVGFSLGATAELGSIGKVLLMVLMFIGRIGPLTVAFALTRPKPAVTYAYPEERIIIV